MSTDERIKAVVGETVTLALRSGAAGGALWQVVSAPDSVFVVAVASEPSGAIGDQAPVEFQLRADAAGEHIIDLELRRPWERLARRKRRVVLEVAEKK